MLTYQIKDRLKEYLQTIGLSVYQLEVDCGFSRGYFNSMKYNIPAKKIDVILEHLPDLNKAWLLTGKGSMTNGVPIQTVDAYPMSENKKISPQERQDIMTRVREAILTKISPTIERYEKQNHLHPGTFEAAIKRGSDRVVTTWLNSVYCKVNKAYSYDWLCTGDGPLFRIKQPYIPVIPASVLNERFNIENERIQPLDKSWIRSYYSEDVPVNIVYGVDNADLPSSSTM